MRRGLISSFPRRLALSSAVVIALVVPIYGALTWPADRLRLQAQYEVVAERAAELGQASYEYKSKVTSDCYSRYLNGETAENCVNSKLFGDFGEYLAARNNRVSALHAGEIAITALLFAGLGYLAIWAAAGAVYPMVTRYFLWLRRGI